MSRYSMNRRRFLRGAFAGAAVSVALPIFEMFMNNSGTAFATGELFPKRFGLFFWGNGVLPDRWVPTGIGADYTLSDQLSPLADVKSLVTVVSGMSVKVPNVAPHGAGPAGILSGAPLTLVGEHMTLSAPSIDQVIAAGIGELSPFRSIEFGASPGSGLSYNGPNNQNPPESNPRALFDRIFGDGFRLPGVDGKPDPRLGVRRSVLDAVLEDAKTLQKRLGKQDRERLDQHLSGVRDLEKRIQFIEENPVTYAACTVDAIPPVPEESYPDIAGRAQLKTKNRIMTDIIAMALACGQTQVFSNYFTSPVNNLLFPDAVSGHHQLTHDEGGDQPQVNAIMKQVIAEYAYVVQKFESIAEGDGTLLDNCIVLGTSDCSLGRTHSLDEYPILLAGSAGGKLHQGIHLPAPKGDNASKVLFSILNALDITVAEFGAAEGKVTSGLSGLEV